MTASIDLHLIAHKVRGEPAFDVATRIECAECHSATMDYICRECDGFGYWWIVPTSGHRAYPYWHEALSILTDGLHNSIPEMPEGLPDHYQTRAAPAVAPRPAGLEAMMAAARSANAPKISRRGL